MTTALLSHLSVPASLRHIASQMSSSARILQQQLRRHELNAASGDGASGGGLHLRLLAGSSASTTGSKSKNGGSFEDAAVLPPPPPSSGKTDAPAPPTLKRSVTLEAREAQWESVVARVDRLALQAAAARGSAHQQRDRIRAGDPIL